MNIKSMPEVGFTTRTGRKIYGLNDYNRDKKIIRLTTAAIVLVALFLAIGMY